MVMVQYRACLQSGKTGSEAQLWQRQWKALVALAQTLLEEYIDNKSRHMLDVNCKSLNNSKLKQLGEIKKPKKAENEGCRVISSRVFFGWLFAFLIVVNSRLRHLIKTLVSCSAVSIGATTNNATLRHNESVRRLLQQKITSCPPSASEGSGVKCKQAIGWQDDTDFPQIFCNMFY